jgi:hypothetical protein
MMNHQFTHDQVREFCLEIHEDDGIDPQRYFQASPKQKRSRKSIQLCGQIAKLLNASFAGWDSPILTRLYVVSVLPAPTVSRLQIVVDATEVPGSMPTKDILQELARTTPGLRAVVAGTIARKYVPELTFRLAAPHEVLQ